MLLVTIIYIQPSHPAPKKKNSIHKTSFITQLEKITIINVYNVKLGECKLIIVFILYNSIKCTYILYPFHYQRESI